MSQSVTEDMAPVPTLDATVTERSQFLNLKGLA